MKKMDKYSYQCGVMDAFNEVVRAGVKRLALAHPCDTKEERDSYLDYAQQLCEKYGNHMYVENDSLLTDLFPISMNKDKFNVLFYRNESYREAYFALKERKAKLVEDKLYKGDVRREIAWEFGKLLSYSDEAIERMIAENDELEEFDF